MLGHCLDRFASCFSSTNNGKLGRFLLNGLVDLKCLRSEGGGQAFGLAGEIHDYAILVRQLGMHPPLDQCESAADAW
jgi:hypothetical protein